MMSQTVSTPTCHPAMVCADLPSSIPAEKMSGPGPRPSGEEDEEDEEKHEEEQDDNSENEEDEEEEN